MATSKGFKQQPAGIRRQKEQMLPPHIKMFHTDSLRKILWLDDSTGLSLMGPIMVLAQMRMGKGYQIRRVPARVLLEIKKSPAFREGIAAIPPGERQSELLDILFEKVREGVNA